jgi:hypothetical protein
MLDLSRKIFNLYKWRTVTSPINTTTGCNLTSKIKASKDPYSYHMFKIVTSWISAAISTDIGGIQGQLSVLSDREGLQVMTVHIPTCEPYRNFYQGLKIPGKHSSRFHTLLAVHFSSLTASSMASADGCHPTILIHKARSSKRVRSPAAGPVATTWL